MSETPHAPRPLGLLGAAWFGLTAVHLALQLTAPRAAATDPMLPFWARAALLATEGAAIAATVALVAALFRGLESVRARLPAAVRPTVPVVRALAAGLVLLGLAASWSSFWLSGQFLDRAGVGFAASNLDSVLSYAARTHPFLLYGMPWVLLGVAALAVEGVPRWLRTARPGPWIGRAAGAAVALCVATAAAGEVGHRFAIRKITDPATGTTYSRDDLYRLRRDRAAGPLTHLVSSCFGTRDPFDDDPSVELPPLVRRPIEPLEGYLARVDRGTLRRWNVIVVLVDSLRADQLRATGGVRDVMPAVDGLAREGRVYTDCTSQASHTDYAAPAVFSSHYPLRARRRLDSYPKDPPYPRVMIYDVLKPLGWRTALFSSQNEEWGQMKNYLQTGSLDVFFHSRTAGVSEEATSDRPAFAGTIDDGLTVSEALKWIEARSDAPFFLYLNLQNSHLPYEVPSGFPRRFSPKDPDVKISIGWFPREKAELVKDVYADSLAYVDAQLERLFARLKERGEWDRTLVVVTGDHGEAFYEHGFSAHANGVYDEVIHVPLVVRAPGLEPGHDGRPSQLIDVVPGLFHLLGLPAHPSFQGENLFGPEPRADRTRYLISETPWSAQLGVVRSGFKLIRDRDTGGAVLYDLSHDPGERVDATDAHPEIARDLRARLAAWRRAQLEYYENPVRQGCEYPPVFRDP